ncbi:MAG: hypothetical protein WC516_05635 [Patescibacteria group bacterium]|jgi:hypothetical protein
MSKEFYLSKRVAQTDELSKRTAISLFKIIQFIFYRVPSEKRLQFFHRLKGKLTRLSPGDIGLKKMPPYSVIGQSVGIAKNLLAGLNPNFVRQVLVELTYLLSHIGLSQIKR